MEIDEIVTRAIPAETCPVKNAGAMDRRVKLKQRILELLERERNKPYQPNLEYKSTIPSAVQPLSTEV